MLGTPHTAQVLPYSEISIEKESLDRINLELPSVQADLIKFLVKHQTRPRPIILVLVNGGPVAIEWEKDNLPAILELWYPGEAGGTAIADVLFGDYNPSGRLPVTVYRADYPTLIDMAEMDMRKYPGRTYRYLQVPSLFDFGFGLSYTNFDYELIQPIVAKKASSAELHQMTVKVTNSGARSGAHVVQLFVRSEHDDAANKELKGFTKIYLRSGESTAVDFSLTSKHLERYVEKVKAKVVLPGLYSAMVGNIVDVFYID